MPVDVPVDVAIDVVVVAGVDGTVEVAIVVAIGSVPPMATASTAVGDAGPVQAAAATHARPITITGAVRALPPTATTLTERERRPIAADARHHGGWRDPQAFVKNLASSLRVSPSGPMTPS